MLDQIVQFLNRRKLAKAQESYAKWKARREYWDKLRTQNLCFIHEKELITAAGEASKFEERVERLMREV